MKLKILLYLQPQFPKILNLTEPPLLIDEKKPVLSFIICSRNDGYMGNPMWRLATSINYLSEKVFEINKEGEVEIVVADWGSKTPISEVLDLTEKSAQLTSFVHVPPDLAQELQQDSSFAEVFALNAAARRSLGQFIGRIDQDTLVTKNFLERFFDAYEGRNDPGFDLKRSYMFASRKQLPYAFVKKQPSLKDLDSCIRYFSKWSYNEELKFCHWASAVGILMMHRDMWDDLGGYDERLIYYWFMDVDLCTRLMKKYPIVNIGRIFGYDYFHLEHIKAGFRFRHSHRKLNPDWAKSFDKPVLNPNGPNWGIAKANLKRTVLSKQVLEDTESDTFKVLKSKVDLVALFLRITAGSVRRLGYNQLKYAWYLSKRLRKKPYL